MSASDDMPESATDPVVYLDEKVHLSLDRLSRMLPSLMTHQVRDACGSDAHRNRS